MKNLYKISVYHSDFKSLINIGKIHAIGYGVDKDIAKAKEYFG